MDEFSLIDDIVNSLDAVAKTSWVSVGSGDDATVISVAKGAEVVSSIDTFTPGIHFPTTAPAKKIGYRAFMAAASDLAAMAALPRYALVALSLPICYVSLSHCDTLFISLSLPLTCVTTPPPIPRV